MNEPLPGWVTPSVGVAAFAALSWAQARRPLRAPVEGGLRRIVRNFATGGLAAAAAFPFQLLLLSPFVRLVEREQLGLLKLATLPDWLEVCLAVLLLDYTLWVWHWVNHRVPFFWRFHLAHHVDLDLDASTAIRFHFGEMTLSVGVRALQILIIGPSPLAISIWTAALFPSILFHHSNLKLPIALERKLVRWIVTPRMHGIHHSTVRAERDSNFASLLTVWDRIHRRLRLGIPQEELRIGVPPHLKPEEVTFGRVQVLPFRKGLNLGEDPQVSRAARGPETELVS